MKGFVYFLRGMTGIVKVGKSKRTPTRRIAEYSPLLPFETELIHVIECDDCAAAENELHTVLENNRLRGEWFRLTDRDVDDIQGGILDYVAHE